MKNIIKQMTLKEKSLLMSGKNVWETVAIDRLDVRSYFLADGPTGIRRQEGSADHLGLNESLKATCFPTSATIANSWNLEAAEQLGKALGVEAANQNVDVLLGPGFNIKRNPRGGRNFEYFSEDPFLSGKMAASYIRGIQSQNVIATPKHFAVNSQEYKRLSSNSIVDKQALNEIYLKPFEIAVKEGNPKSIMSSYNLVNGIYANENKELLIDMLRNKWDFDGFVVTDWGGSNDHVSGVNYGSNLQMPGTGVYGALEIEEAVKDNNLSEKVLDERVYELLSSLSFTDEPIKEELNVDKHHLLAQSLAAESVVLLKNEEAILPILDKNKTISVMGDFAIEPRYQGSGSSQVNSYKVDTLKQVIENSNYNYIGFSQGFKRINQFDSNLIKEAVSLANKSDYTIVNLGLDESLEIEGKDRENINISQNQIELLKALKKTNSKIIVVVSAGGVIDMTWEKYADVILHGYLGGQAAAQAIFDVITGKVNPSGKLNETYPFSEDDVPYNNQFPNANINVPYKESIFVGYRYYEKANKNVKYPFGFGLSYSEFKYSGLKVSKDSVSYTIENIGNYSGSEVSQLYIGLKDTKILRPLKVLKGFNKTYIEKGQSKEITIKLDDQTFTFFNSKTNKWETEPGVYDIYIGSSSSDIRLVGNLEIQGDVTEYPYDIKTLGNYQMANLTNDIDDEFNILLHHNNYELYFSNKLHINSTVEDLKNANSLICRMVAKTLIKKVEKDKNKGKADLNLLFILNMPLRGLSKFAGEFFSLEMVESVLKMAKTNLFYGLGSLMKSVRRSHRKKKQFLKEFKEENEN